MSSFTKGNQYNVQILSHKHLFILVQIAFLSFCNLFWGILIVQVFTQQIILLFNTVIGTWMSPPDLTLPPLQFHCHLRMLRHLKIRY